MAEQITNTMVEMRSKIMKMIGEAKLSVELTDADMAELMELEAFIIEKNRQPIAQMEQQGLVPSGPPPGMMGGGVPGVGSMPNIDEMARMLR